MPTDARSARGTDVVAADATIAITVPTGTATGDIGVTTTIHIAAGIINHPRQPAAGVDRHASATATP